MFSCPPFLPSFVFDSLNLPEGDFCFHVAKLAVPQNDLFSNHECYIRQVNVQVALTPVQSAFTQQKTYFMIRRLYLPRAHTARALKRTGRLLVDGSGEDDLFHSSVSLSPQTCQVDVRSGHVARAVSLGLRGDGARQPGLRGVLPPHVAQVRLCRVRLFRLQIGLALGEMLDVICGSLLGRRYVHVSVHEINEKVTGCLCLHASCAC